MLTACLCNGSPKCQIISVFLRNTTRTSHCLPSRLRRTASFRPAWLYVREHPCIESFGACRKRRARIARQAEHAATDTAHTAHSAHTRDRGWRPQPPRYKKDRHSDPPSFRCWHPSIGPRSTTAYCSRCGSCRTRHPKTTSLPTRHSRYHGDQKISEVYQFAHQTVTVCSPR